MNLFPSVFARSIGRIGPGILRGMDTEQSRTGGDWREDARAAVKHLSSAKDLTPGAAAALLALEAALLDANALPASSASAAKAWPVLTRTAQVHGTVFHPGTSTQAVIDEAVRYYEFEQQPPRVASRESVLDRFGAHLARLTEEKPEH